MRRAWAVRVALVMLAAVGVAAQSYVPNRVYLTAKKQFVDFEALAADVARADVAFVAEQHDDVNTHRLERALLEGLLRRRGDIVLSLEMFERDVQEPLMHFGMGHMEESEFLGQSRPWPQYQRDYKPLVDFAVAHNWSVVAANVPRDIATAVAKSGLEALATRPDSEKTWFAKDRSCDAKGDYFERFTTAMGGHNAQAGMDDKTMARYYASQCLKDETMAESIAQAYVGGAAGGKRPLVVHVTGAFHAEYGQGTVSRTRSRLPGKRVVTLSILPVNNLDAIAPDGDDRKRADYLVYTYTDKKP